ncbi:MAG: regulator [Verrucomicrobiales bacterium]|nr:regulator [Verrucomicrobiales bacterium]MCP5526332.1 regulator [Verrucomicrobiales bacterium]
MTLRFLVALGLGGGVAAFGGERVAPVPDVPFWQEFHEPHPIETGGAGDDVRAVLVDGDGTVWAATRGGVFRLRDGVWERPSRGPDGPAYDLIQSPTGQVWIAAWDGVYTPLADSLLKWHGVPGPVTVLGAKDTGLVALGPEGAWQQEGSVWYALPVRWSRNVRGSAFDPARGWWIATGTGLYEIGPVEVRLQHRPEDLVSTELQALTFGPDGRLWIGSLGGLDVHAGGNRVGRFTGANGLPHYDVRSLTFGPDGRLWVGTGLGVARFDGDHWSLRHSRRWLLSDDVRDVAVDADGTAWVATDRGVSAIKRRRMTLADKAAWYLDICRARHVRPPGFVEKCFFPDPADRSQFEPRDDDNDGQYTAMYLAMESYRFAVTGAPDAKHNADTAYDALEFLQTVTGTESFVARTVIPVSWTRMADPNEEIDAVETVERRRHDPRYKIVEQRWRPSADGRWLWKGDTSSDEITGHLYGYLVYFDLAADDARKSRVQRLVARIMDGIIDGGYVLRDLDGEPTRWGVWSPEKLNHDPDWRVERPINSFEILSYLRAAHHITGNGRYLAEFRRLIDEQGYAENARRPKAYGLGERTHIDDELLALAAPGLLMNEREPRLHAHFLAGYEWAYRTVEHEQNPFFNFAFGMLGGTGFHLEETVAFLRDTPLDLRQWTVDNSARDDVELVRRPLIAPLQTSRMLPPSERGVMRWDKNPWEVRSGDFHDPEGRLESCGVFWLLPYWMGRHAGFIGPLDAIDRDH